MAIELNSKGVSHARNLIKKGEVDLTSGWDFTAEDGNEILNNDDWEEYSLWFLAVDTDEPKETKSHYKFPYGKGGKVYRSGVIAAKQRAAQQGYAVIVEAADELLNLIDKGERRERRHYTIRQEDIKDNRTIVLSFSSETPVERWYGVEILDHSEGAVNLDWLRNNGAVLVNHDPDKHVGVIEDVYIDPQERKGRAVVRFGRSAFADEVYRDVLDGIKRSVSVGYAIDETITEKVEDNGRKWVRVTKWTPLEISLVSVPADIAVGVGRTDEKVISKMCKIISKEEKTMDEKVIGSEEERKRVGEILAIAEAHNCMDMGKRAITEGMSVDEFRGLVLKEKYGANKATIDASLGLSQKEARNFSFVRAINALIARDWTGAEYEKEISDAVAQKLRKPAQGFYVPLDVMRSSILDEAEKRTLTKGTGSAGGYTVATTLLVTEFIELLRNNMMVRQLGARVLSGLVGDIAIPAQTGGASGYWVGETGAPSASQATFDQVVMTPKTVGGYTDISRKLLLQSSIDVEAFVRNDLATAVALAIDYAAINGSGESHQPKGVLNTTGVGLVELGDNGGSPTYAKIVELWQSVASNNALQGSLGFLTNSLVVATLSTTPKVDGYPMFLINDLPGQDGLTTLLGLPCATSNQVPSNLTKGTGSNLSAILFGNWRDLVIGEWGAIDVLVDPYTGGTSGNVRVRVFQDIDIAIRHAKSFAVIKDCVTQ